MSIRQTSGPRRAMARLGTLLIALAALTAGSVSTASPAMATECDYHGHVYYRLPYDSGNWYAIKYETNPVGAAPHEVSTTAGGWTIELGGNGLKEYSTPVWEVTRSDGSHYTTFTGNQVHGGSCVANQRSITLPGSAGDTLLLKVTYRTGNTGLEIHQQNHFRVTFVQAPPPPPPPPDDECDLRHASRIRPPDC